MSDVVKRHRFMPYAVASLFGLTMMPVQYEHFRIADDAHGRLGFGRLILERRRYVGAATLGALLMSEYR